MILEYAQRLPYNGYNASQKWGASSMRKNNKLMILFAAIGVIVGSIVTNALADVTAIQFLTKAMELGWSPAADLNVLRYSFDFHFKVNLLNVAGLVLGIWVYKKI
jgi:hypothetical protein